MVRAIALVRDYLLRTHDSFFHINFASSCLLCWFLIYSPRIKGCQLPTVYSIWSRVFWAELALINCISITFLSLKLCINLLVKLLTTLLPDLHGSSIYIFIYGISVFEIFTKNVAICFARRIVILITIIYVCITFFPCPIYQKRNSPNWEQFSASWSLRSF